MTTCRSVSVCLEFGRDLLHEQLWGLQIIAVDKPAELVYRVPGSGEIRSHHLA